MADHGDGSNESTRLLGKVIESAREQRPDDPLVEAFLAAYYRELPVYDLDDRGADDLHRVAIAHLDFGRRRSRGQPLLQVITADRERDGWPVRRSVVMMVTDDAPFLVDTMRIALERLRVATHHMVHPIVPVERDDDGQLVAIRDGSDRLEAWTQIEIEVVDGDRARLLEVELTEIGRQGPLGGVGVRGHAWADVRLLRS